MTGLDEPRPRSGTGKVPAKALIPQALMTSWSKSWDGIKKLEYVPIQIKSPIQKKSIYFQRIRRDWLTAAKVEDDARLCGKKIILFWIVRAGIVVL